MGKAGGSAGCSRGGGRTHGWPEGLAPGSPLRNHGRDGPDQGETQRRLTWMEGTENLPGDPPCPPEAALRFVRVSAICVLVTIQATFLGVWPECHSGIFAQGPFPRGPSPSPARASSGSDPGRPRPHHRQPAAGCLRPAPPLPPSPVAVNSVIGSHSGWCPDSASASSAPGSLPSGSFCTLLLILLKLLPSFKTLRR